jgi:hypothetical protein
MATRRKKKALSKRIAKRPIRAPRAGTTVSVPLPTQIASDVWLEIGEIWLERNPTIEDEVTIREAHTRRVKQAR